MKRCIDCGYLGLVRRSDGQVCEAGPQYRDEGFISVDRSKYTCFESPVCLHALMKIETRSAKDGHSQACKEIDCDLFEEYKPGLSPRELAMETVSEQRAVIQRLRDEKAEAIREQRELNDRHDATVRWWIRTFLIVVSILVSIIALMATFN